MREYILEDYVIEQKGTENVSYLLKQNDIFFLTGYKVLTGKENRGLVECARLRWNGRIKLVYFSSQYISLQTIVSYLDVMGIRTVLRNLISDILLIKGNGFLKCENIDVSPEKIFVDRNTLEVYLIYLPVKIIESEYDRNVFENELRTRLIKLLNSVVNLSGPEIKEILFELSNGSTSLEQLYRFLQKEEATGRILPQTSSEQADRLVMESVDGKNRFEISGGTFTIGKSTAVNGIISDNPAVSRRHCKVVREGEQYFLVDTNSSNGTFVNGSRIAPESNTRIRSGDRIRIANIDFVVR